MSQGARIQLQVTRRPAAEVISELQQEVAHWRGRALKAEARVAELLRENEQLRARVASLEETVKELRAEIALLKREGKRSAGPFSKNKRKNPRKKPGRKKGQGRFSHLEGPPSSPDTNQVDIPTPQTCDCGGALEFLSYEEASNTDPPKNAHPHVTKFRVPVCRCCRCGATVRGRHADLAPDQYGATAHRYGDQMMAVAHVLHYGMGIPQQKVPDVVDLFTGVRPTPSALNQDAVRRSAEELAVNYEVLRDSMKGHAVGHTDATGWRVDGQPAQLAVYATSDATLYDIREHYRNDEIRAVFPDDYKGTVVGDGAKAFDANKLSGVKQQKCLFHGLKLIGEAQEKQQGQALAFGSALKDLLKEGLALWHAYHDGKRRGYRAKVADLEARITEHLCDRVLDDEDNQRLLRFFGAHHARGNLTRFLHDPRVPPTNNLSELELRYMITARKVSQCSKNERGAHARKVLGSLIRTEARTLAKERRQSKKPYADQRSFQAEERKASKTKLKQGRAPAGRVEPQVHQGSSAGATGARALADRVAALFRHAKHRARAVKDLMATALGARARAP